jgi:hypothetical protein
MLEEKVLVSSSLRLSALACALIISTGVLSSLAQTPATQQPAVPPVPQETKPGKTAPPPVEEAKKKQQQAKAVQLKDLKNPTAEQVAEIVIAIYGGSYGRAMLNQVRRNGVENGRITRTPQEGQPEEISYEQRFVHGESFLKDKIRLDQKTPSMEYALVYNAGQIWGIINGTPFTPREDATKDFLAQSYHGIDALLRYKENGSTLAYVARDKLKNIDLWIIDLKDKENRRTRYFVSANPDIRLTGRVLWLEYEEPNASGGEPTKYRRTFHEYRYAQNTLVPFRSVLYANDRQLEEMRINTVTYGIKMDDTYFQNPQSASN